jgi:hypothetical protein
LSLFSQKIGDVRPCSVQQRWIVPITTEPYPTWATHIIPAAGNGVLVAGQAQQSDEILAQFHYYFAEAPLKNNLLDSQASLTELGFNRLDDMARVDDRLYLLGTNATESRLISIDDQLRARAYLHKRDIW